MSNVLVVFCLSGLSGSLTFFQTGQEKKKKNRIRNQFSTNAKYLPLLIQGVSASGLPTNGYP